MPHLSDEELIQQVVASVCEGKDAMRTMLKKVNRRTHPMLYAWLAQVIAERP